MRGKQTTHHSAGFWGRREGIGSPLRGSGLYPMVTDTGAKKALPFQHPALLQLTFFCSTGL